MKSIRMGRNVLITTVFMAGVASLLIGCQTTVPVAWTEPARFDMNDINKVGIVSNNNEATVTVSNALTKTGKYTVASAEEMKALEAWREQQKRLADGIEINAAALAKEYDDNEVRADGKYDGKNLKVSGTVTDFKAGGAVRLGVGNNSVDVYVAKFETEKVAALNKGDTVTVVGRCSGLKAPYSDGINEILEILGGGGKHVNIASATFYISEYAGPVDAVIEINETHSENIENRTTKKPATTEDGETLKDADGKTIYKDVVEYRKVVTATLSYSLTNTYDGTVIGSDSSTGKYQSPYNEDSSMLTPTSNLVSSALKNPLAKVVSDLVPTSRTLSVKLAKSDTQDKDLKAAIAAANKLVKAKNYSGAAEAFGKIYADSKDWSAGYNQAVLTEVAVGTEQALELMGSLAKISDNPEVQSMLAEMQRRNAANKRAAEQMRK